MQTNHFFPVIRIVATCRHLFFPCFHCERIVCDLSCLRRLMMLEVLPCILLHEAVNFHNVQRALYHLSHELRIFEHRKRHRLLYQHAQRRKALLDDNWLHSCEQLLYRMHTELTALSAADPFCLPSPRVRERLRSYGVRLPQIPHTHTHSHIMDYHVLRLLNICAYLDDMLAIAEDTPKTHTCFMTQP